MLEFLWRAGVRTSDRRLFSAVELALTRMSEGGIYDHLGGGYARYSVDERWLVPHFEKMLYDNALLLELLALAHQRSGNELFRSRARETVAPLDELCVGPVASARVFPERKLARTTNQATIATDAIRTVVARILQRLIFIIKVFISYIFKYENLKMTKNLLLNIHNILLMNKSIISLSSKIFYIRNLNINYNFYNTKEIKSKLSPNKRNYLYIII